jgi:hypothetical protein
MIITKVNCPANKIAIKCPYSMVPEGITVHNTANDASAMSEISYMLGNNNYNSFHYAVDDYRAVQGLELNRNGFHASDGANGFGNRKTIGIEICYSKSGGERFLKAEENAAELIAGLLKQYNWGIEKVKRHHDYDPWGKYCPHRTMDLGWERFLRMIEEKMGKKPVSNTINVGDKVKITTMSPYKYWVADDAQLKFGIYQVREDVNAGGTQWFEWADNGIPEECIDLVHSDGRKRSDSDRVHAKKGDKFVFARVFTVIGKGVDSKNKKTYYLVDYKGNKNYAFWVVGDFLKKV